MGRVDFEKDLERGDVDRKIVDEKRGEFESQQSSPTLTQGTFESDRDAKGMKWNRWVEFEILITILQRRLQPRHPHGGRRG